MLAVTAAAALAFAPMQGAAPALLTQQRPAVRSNYQQVVMKYVLDRTRRCALSAAFALLRADPPQALAPPPAMGFH